MKTVLTIDDSKVVRSMVTRQLQRYGCTVQEAGDGAAGLEAARRHQPDLILLDVTMPVMDGRQCLAELRKDAACKTIPVVMLTAESGRDIVVEIAKLGVTGYIIKPFQQETFDAEVSKVLGPPAAAPGPDAALDAGAVLVVDDSQKVLDAAAAALSASMKVLTALSGSAAVARYEEARPAVVVVDLAMPDMDGFATLAELQKRGKSTFLALALRGDDAAKEKARKAGFAEVLEKPFQGEDLLAQVRAALAGGSSPDDLLRACLAEDDGCMVFALPAASPKVLPLFAKKLRGLAEEGTAKLILDLAALSDVTSDHLASLARVLGEAGTLGIRTAICSANEQVASKLRQIAETKDAPCAATREAARASLQ